MSTTITEVTPFEELNRPRLLIIDDLGAERSTDFSLEQVYMVIDSRYASGKPMILTTNLSLEELEHPQDRIHARMNCTPSY